MSFEEMAHLSDKGLLESYCYVVKRAVCFIGQIGFGLFHTFDEICSIGKLYIYLYHYLSLKNIPK